MLCCPQPLNLISAQSEALQSFDVAQPFLKEYQLFEEDYVNLFRQIIIKTLQNYPNPQNSAVLVETSHQNHLSFTTLYRLFREAQFSFILRDGRDEVISLLKNKINQGYQITLEDITNASIEWLNSIRSGLHNLQNISKLGAQTSMIKLENFFRNPTSDPQIINLFNRLEIDSFLFSRDPNQEPPEWKKILSKPQIDILINEMDQILNQMDYLNDTPW